MAQSVLPAYHQKQLDNGLNVVAIPMENGTGVISVDVFYRVGSRNETMGKSGIAHMLEHLNFKSTENMKAGEFDEIVKGFGGVNNASTGFDYTHYFIKTATPNLEHSLSLFADMMANLKLLDEEFQPERDVVTEERRWRTDNNPMGYMYFKLFNNLFVYHPYHWTPIGFMSDIRNWNIEDIRTFHQTYYAPNNAYVVVSGDFDPETLFKAAEAQFGKIPKGPEIPKVHMKEPPQDGEKRVVVYKESNVEMLAIAYHIPEYTHADISALNAISEILSGGQSSRLQERLVHQTQLANQIYAYSMDLIDPGAFIIMAVCNPGIKAEELEAEITQELNRILEGDIETSELEKVKKTTRADFIYSLEGSSSVSNLFGSYLVRGDITPLIEYEARINALDIKTIQTVAKRYFTPKNSTTLILRNEEKQ